MKQNLIKFLLVFVILFTVSLAASAQVYVKIRPPVPVMARPPQPSNAHVWVGEEWEPSGGAYKYSGSHWATPPHPGYVRKSGYWKHRKHEGDEWIQGSWKKGK